MFDLSHDPNSQPNTLKTVSNRTPRKRRISGGRPCTRATIDDSRKAPKPKKMPSRFSASSWKDSISFIVASSVVIAA